MHPDSVYEAEPVRCHACEARELEQQAFVEGDGETAGLYMSVRKVDDEEG